MEADRLTEIQARLAAAKASQEWGQHGLDLTMTPATVEHPNARIWYGDGDQCAEIHDNLGLGLNGDAIAKFFAGAPKDVTDLLAEVERLRGQKQELKDLLARRQRGEPWHMDENHACAECETLKKLMRSDYRVEHCDRSPYCAYSAERRCTCLCGSCKDAKARDH